MIMNMIHKGLLLLRPETDGSWVESIATIIRVPESQGSCNALGFRSPGLSHLCSGKRGFSQVE